ncbi:hypothetical protein Emtol_2828 [Emticicia oligotrophica DSM 17448]|uniref:Uncharacterized protein n=1 Tax=Emticicia oligotrophica (strain DSM 17448 / CIP 109782 / MTCC 6937 / GPTSA100-15) TaxID=929562 RepID=A0ABM5N3R4_EMTOG|nr:MULTISPECIES: hypothetical protein [Emticicia]AFK03963.1 hypothetical protein Emtol_2828 [Emticicia oligotrophica DSM 17448]
MSNSPIYNESEFVAYALNQMNIKILRQEGKYFDLEGGFSVEVEGKDLYRLSVEDWVISPFEDIGKMCEFIKKNLEISQQNE